MGGLGAVPCKEGTAPALKSKKFGLEPIYYIVLYRISRHFKNNIWVITQ